MFWFRKLIIWCAFAAICQLMALFWKFSKFAFYQNLIFWALLEGLYYRFSKVSHFECCLRGTKRMCILSNSGFWKPYRYVVISQANHRMHNRGYLSADDTFFGKIWIFKIFKISPYELLWKGCTTESPKCHILNAACVGQNGCASLVLLDFENPIGMF